MEHETNAEQTQHETNAEQHSAAERLSAAKRLSAAERIRLTLRARGMITRYCPGLMRSIFLKALFSALQPFAAIWFASLIINEIAAGEDFGRAVALAAVAISANFALSVFKGRIDSFHGERETQMWSYFSKIFADKQLSMDYVDIEDAAVQRRKTREKENLFFFGNGLGQFVWTIKITIEGAANVVVSLFIVVGLFIVPSGVGFADSPLWAFAIAAVIALSIFANTVVFKKNNDLFTAWCEKFAWFHRIFWFFGYTLSQDHERAKDVRIYGQDAPAENEMTKHIDKDKQDRSYYFISSAYESAAAFFTGLSHVVFYLYVAIKIFYGAIGAGGVVLYAGALGRFAGGVQQLVYGITDNEVYTMHLKSLFDFLDLPNKKRSGTLPVKKPGGDGYEIEFSNVSFKYPGTDFYALRNLNMKLSVGKRLAIVGMNGSGKTTMIKLLCRLYDPDEGIVTLDGVDIKEYRYDEYLNIFSVVFQDFKLFSLPLGQNVASSAEPDKAAATESLNKSGFRERLAEMPKGLDTYLYKDFEEDGVEISGGEAQKIALARTLYKDAPFIILDEPTAALDPVAEFEIYSKFNEIIGRKTAVFISHRLYSCRFCDDIAVFHEGELIQRGDHETLLSVADGKYRELWDAQARYYNDAGDNCNGSGDCHNGSGDNRGDADNNRNENM